MNRLPNFAWLLIALTVGLAIGSVWYFRRTDRENERAALGRAAFDAGAGLYVDDKVCAECHAQQAREFGKTGHANTFWSSTESKIARGLDGRTFEDPERGYTYRFHFDERNGLSVAIPKQFGQDLFPLQYVLGSGHNAVTFLTLIPNRLGDTTGIEHRVSLYPKGGGWECDLTPGHQGHVPRQDVEHHGKVFQGDTLNRCVGCHTTSGEISRQQIVNLRPHVGCQSCHGPGREHLIAIEQGLMGNYAGFTKQSANAEIQLCGRCHRLPNSDADTKVDPNNIHIVRFQSVGLLQTKCYKRSGESLRCSTCHDPHQPVSRDTSQYVQRCLDCHGNQNLKACSVSPRSGCIDCHMPPLDIHRGIKFHDHWIRVRADVGRGAASESAEGKQE